MYTALYRKWRPKAFDDIYGQDQVTITLKNEIKENKISHAYLFCGTRGTGKTSTAKLLAKVVNCMTPDGYNPCDKCQSCISINEGNSIDVFEIDAASNRGIDDIRNLREAIKFTPTLGKYKVYIIDEVHMLTNEAFNALLKTLEEPPDYVLFILATTEPHKLPATILSRCQRFDFKRISVDNIISRVKHICEHEGLHVDEAAIRLIARNSDGALRDALSILDQCSVYGSKQITHEEVLEVLGIVNNEFLFNMGEVVLKGDAAQALLLVNELSAGGRDINQFIRDLTLHYRNLLMTKVVDKPEDVIDMSAEGIEMLKRLAQEYNKDNIIRCINVLSELENEAKWASHPRILLEIAIVKLCKLTNDNSYEGILARLAYLEEAISKGKLIINPNEALVTADVKPVQSSTKQELPKKPKPKQDMQSNISEILSKWGGFIQDLKTKGKIKLRTYLILAKPIKFENGIIVLSYSKEDVFCKEAMETPAVRSEVEQAASDYYGCTVRIKCIFEEEADSLHEEEDIDIVKAAMQLVGEDKVEVVVEE